MAWTAKITAIKKVSNGRIDISMEFTDGTRVVAKEFSATGSVNLEWLKLQAKNTIDALTAIDALADGITIGDFDATITHVAPTQAEIDRDAWFDDYTRWTRVKTLIDSGILTGTEPAVTTLKTKVQTDFKPAYINFM